jgi:hypothetical protein
MTGPLDNQIARAEYSEAELVRILRMAAELDARSSGQSKSEKLTLTEIEQIAAEVGIAAEHVAAAAALVATEASEKWKLWLGVPIRGSFTRVLPGTVSASAWPEVVAALRQTLGHAGQHSYVPGALEWVHTDEGSEVRVEVSSSENGAHVQISADHRQSAALSLMVMPVLGACAAVIPVAALGVGAVVEPWVWLSGGAASGFVGGWAVLRVKGARWQRRLRGMLQSLAEITASGQAAGSTPR